MTSCLRSLGAAAVAMALAASGVAAQQVVDTTFTPRLRVGPTFASGTRPVVMIDEAHNNFHTASGRYRPFVRLVEADGFRVQPSAARFDSASLARANVMVIANAVAEQNKASANWRLPARSAFAPDEIAAVAAWVRRGGTLLLIADHLPFAGAADSLASALGVYFANGFALPAPYAPDPRTGDYPIVFRRGAGLVRHPIIEGRTRAEHVDSIVSFTGSAFRLGNVERPRELMRLPSGTRVRLPTVAWEFSDSTPEIRGDGLLQGATFELGRGRVAVFGEAAMFSAQIKGAQRTPMGMNAPEAAENAQFVLNVLHWLVGRISDR